MRNISRQNLLRLSGVLFLLAAAAFWFSPVRWMAAIEGCLGLLMVGISMRAGRNS